MLRLLIEGGNSVTINYIPRRSNMFNSRLTRRNFYYILGAAAVIVAAALLAVLISPDKEPDTEELPDELRTALSVSEVTKVNPGKEKLE